MTYTTINYQYLQDVFTKNVPQKVTEFSEKTVIFLEKKERIGGECRK